MKNILYIFVLSFLISSCSKKNVPSRSAKIIYDGSDATASQGKIVVPVESSNPAEVKTVRVIEPKEEKKLFPETIYVNDAAAKKSVDGRLYYDVEGHRYWKNYKDGKYYLFNKSMYKNPDFKPPIKGNKG